MEASVKCFIKSSFYHTSEKWNISGRISKQEYHSHLDQHPVFISCISSGITAGNGCSLMAARWQPFFFLSSLGLTCSQWRTVTADDCDILVY